MGELTHPLRDRLAPRIPPFAAPARWGPGVRHRQVRPPPLWLDGPSRRRHHDAHAALSSQAAASGRTGGGKYDSVIYPPSSDVGIRRWVGLCPGCVSQIRNFCFVSPKIPFEWATV